MFEAFPAKEARREVEVIRMSNVRPRRSVVQNNINYVVLGLKSIT